jgi:hypothetical protein
VFPSVSPNDPAYRSGRHAIFTRNAFFGLPLDQRGLNGANVVLGKFCSVMVSAMRHIPSALCQFVAVVFAASAKPQMIGINAPLNIARMANAHSLWDWSVRVFIHKPMGALNASIKFNLAVAKNAALLAIPNPTAFLLVDLIPKPLWKLFHSGEYSSATNQKQMVKING